MIKQRLIISNVINTMGLITEYFVNQKKYEAQYGERTVVLTQVGAFYEMWQYEPSYCTSDEAKLDEFGNMQTESVGHAIELSIVLNCILTVESKSEPYSYKHPHKVGFPMIAYEKNRDTLLSNDYVIIRIDQVKTTKTTKGPEERYVAEICSPTMQLDHISSRRATSNNACIYIEYHQGMNHSRNRYENFVITTGAAVVDVITGHNRVCEFYSKNEDQVHAVQELYRFLIAHYPRELIIHINDMPVGLDSHTDTTPNPYVKYLERVLELRRFDRMNVYVNNVPADYKKTAYQVEVLNKLFTKPMPSQSQGISLNIIQKRNEKIIEELNLERMNYGRIAYMLLMQHCHSHNVDIISKLPSPDLQWIDDQRHLILTHNAIVQLDLISADKNGSSYSSNRKKEIDSLMSVLDHNQTHLGRRALHTLLQNPMLNSNDIELYYNMVNEMSIIVTENDVLWMTLDRQLKELPDIGRLQRKLEIKLITPRELAILYGAYIKIINIYVTILNVKTPILHSQMFHQEDISSFNEFIARFSGIIDFDSLECCHIDTSSESNIRWLEFVKCPIRSGYYPDLDAQSKALAEAENSLQQIVDHLNGFITNSRGKKIEFKTTKKKQGAKKQEPTGIILTTTAAKANELSASSINTNLCGNIAILPYTSSDRMITSDRISNLCGIIDGIRMWMRKRLVSIYDSIVEEMVAKYTFYVPVASLIAKLDLLHSYAKISAQYNYHRPEIVSEGMDCSYLEARDIRHPIIERIIDGAYVTNDIFLGNSQNIIVESSTDQSGIVQSSTDQSGIVQNGTDRNVIVQSGTNQNELRSDGILLFGVNQTGKSSLAKAVAVNIIMAQIGCYVPSRLKYKPYSKIITRLSGNDNIFKGESSFAVEITELRTILRQSDQNTLVIGDELCKGTETDSGMAIASSAILSLINKRTSFIFATHMHDILKLSYIRNLQQESLKICHLAINYNEATKDLTYNRKMLAGSGPSNYGLMVAKSLGLPNDFMDVANEILLEITGENKELVDITRSRYNKKLYVDSCARCNKNRNQTELHNHHIIERKHANEKGIITGIIKGDDGINVDIGIIQKNAKDNLIVLCRDCHTSLHQKKQELETLSVGNGTIIRVRPEVPTNYEAVII